MSTNTDPELVARIAKMVWEAELESPLGQALQSIPLSDYITATTTTTTSDNITWAPTTGTYTIPELEYTHPWPYSQPWIDRVNPWETTPLNLDLQPFTTEAVLQAHEVAELEIIKKAETVKNLLTGETFLRVQINLPETALEEITENIRRLELEFKMAVVRAIRLIPPPQRLRTLILEDESNDSD